MKERQLGQTELKTTDLAYGFWRFAGTSVKEARAKVEAALECGMVLMDHADIYGAGDGTEFGDAEALFGEVLKENPGIRDEITLATKGGIVLGVPYDSSADYLRLAVENSLRRLHVDVIDLYQIHRPDFLGHPAEVAATLSALREEGKIKEVGVSNYTRFQTRALQSHLDFPLATVQPEFSVLETTPLRDGVLDLCMETHVTPLAWSPLGGGRLFSDSGPGTLQAVQAELDRIGNEQGVSRTAVALAWILRHPSRPVVIVGTQRVERIRESVDALKVVFGRRDWNSVLEASEGAPLP